MNIGFDAKRVFHNRTGLGNYGRDLIRILGSIFPTNHYFLYNPKPGKSNLFNANFNWVTERMPNGRFWRFFYNLWRQYGILYDLKKDKIDLYHGLSAELPVGISRTGIKSVVTVHDLIFLRFPQFYTAIDAWIYRKKTGYAVKNADLVVAISKQTRQDIIDFYKVDPAKIRVVYQGCQQVFQQPMDEETRLSVVARFKLPGSFILNVGTIEQRKNLLSVVKAIEDLDTWLVVVGSETPYAKEVKAYITSRGMESKIIFLKGLTSIELAALYKSATVFVYMSLFEGFGIPIVEALFSGTPVVTSKGGCFAEAGGHAALYADPANIDEIKETILKALNNNEMRQNMRQNGLEYARQFTDENIGKKYMALYEEIASTKSSYY
ncbi:MAG TPA: glycosyltransferase family 1 protein [Bacteroidales bacterium]|nr:glycosyltransferase family 1 protein [Bacteroidales bacterium]